MKKISSGSKLHKNYPTMHEGYPASSSPPLLSSNGMLIFLHLQIAENGFLWNRYRLDNPANWPRDGCNPNAYTPLSPVQPLCICKFLENLHHHHLENNCHCNDSHKQFVGVYSLEDILLLKLPRVELIEHLAKYKCIKDQGVLYLIIYTKDCFASEL